MADTWQAKYFVVLPMPEKIIVAGFQSYQIASRYWGENAINGATMETASNQYVQYAIQQVQNGYDTWPVVIWIRG